MKLDDDALLNLFWDATLTFDPTGSTVVLEVDGTQHAATWLAAPVQSGGSWTQTARTTARFAGSAVTVSGSDVQPATGRRMCQWLVTTADGQRVPSQEFALDVK